MLSSNRIISADEVAGAKPFQLRDLADPAPPGGDAAGSAGNWRAAPFGAHAQSAVADDAELARRLQQAYAEGHANGKAEAQAARARQAERELEQRLAQFSDQVEQLLGATQAAMHAFENDAAQRVIDLALMIAGRLMSGRIHDEPGAIVPIVEQCLRLKADAEAPALLLMHPVDCSVVADQLAARLAAHHVELLADAGIERGGCRLVGAGGEVDATLATRWRELLVAIGRDPDAPAAVAANEMS